MTWMQVALVAALILSVACRGGPSGGPSFVDPPGARACGSDTQEDLDAGLESRTVAAGPLSMVTSRVSSVPSGDSPVRSLKVSVRVDAGAEATLRTTTPGTSLLFDRKVFRQDNVYRLEDGIESVRFVGCARRSAMFVGSVLTTGPRVVTVEVTSGGGRTLVTLAPFAD